MSSTLLLPPPANSFVIGPAVINTHTSSLCVIYCLTAACCASHAACCSAVRLHVLVCAMTALYRRPVKVPAVPLLQSFCGLAKSKNPARNERENCPKAELDSRLGFRFETNLRVCVECLIGKQKKPILFKVTEPSSIPYRTHPACAKRAAYPDPPPVIPLPESIAAQPAYQLRYKNTENYSWVPTRVFSDMGAAARRS